jgi:hypothetical protein
MRSKTDFTFSNINMRNVLGAAWDKYDMFTMKVASVATAGAVNTTISGSVNGVICYNMAGLTWENLHYDTALYESNIMCRFRLLWLQTSVPNLQSILLQIQDKVIIFANVLI